MRRALVITVALMVALVVALEVGARPLATRVAVRALDCAASVEVTSVGRPASMALLRRELRDVELIAEGVVTRTVRLDRVEAHLPVVRGVTDDVARRVEVRATVSLTATDLQSYVRDHAPAIARPTIGVTADGVIVSDERVPFGLVLTPFVEDGVVRLRVGSGDSRLWDSLGLAPTVPLPAELEVEDVTAADGVLHLDVRAMLRDGAEIAALCL